MDPVAKALQLIEDDATSYGCAEATLAALKSQFGLPDPGSSTEALALNGGIGYSGGTCGAITGAAVALGLLAGVRTEDRATAKTTARRLTQRVMKEFASEFGATRCSDLTGFDLARDHDAFIDSGVWDRGCKAQIAFVLESLAPLRDPTAWKAAAEDVAAGEIPLD